MSFPVTRPTGRGLLVGNPASRAQPLSILGNLGLGCDEADDVYIALAKLCRSPQTYQAVILSMASLYKEELTVIQTLKRRFPKLDVWLAQADGRHALMIEAIRHGADGLLAEDGLHRIGMPDGGDTGRRSNAASTQARNAGSTTAGNGNIIHSNGAGESRASDDDDEPDRDSADELDLEMAIGEPVLSADELRALLQEQPFLPPQGDERSG